MSNVRIRPSSLFFTAVLTIVLIHLSNIHNNVEALTTSNMGHRAIIISRSTSSSSNLQMTWGSVSIPEPDPTLFSSDNPFRSFGSWYDEVNPSAQHITYDDDDLQFEYTFVSSIGDDWGISPKEDMAVKDDRRGVHPIQAIRRITSRAFRGRLNRN